MTDNSEDARQRGERRPYVKPFVRNLDVIDTESKTYAPAETVSFFGGFIGPS
jgi:hypothetical protein